MPYDEVMLIRCPPGTAAAERLLASLRDRPGDRLFLFFHGPGLDWAVSEPARQTLTAIAGTAPLRLCSAGWRRRQLGSVPSGWRLSSLVQFWDVADRAGQVIGFGALGD